MNVEVPIWEKFSLTIDEAAAYFRVGQNKLRKIINDDKNADYILWNGSRPQIKRTKFERYLEGVSLI